MRSVNRDLESSIILLSQHAELTEKLRLERANIWAEAAQVTAETFEKRKGETSIFVNVAIPFAKNYM